MEKLDQYRTNQFMTINIKFLLIENHFKVLTNSPKRLYKLYSHLNLLKRPNLKSKKMLINKKSIKNPLDQIGNDDLIFNNDKLITNIKLEDLSKDEYDIKKEGSSTIKNQRKRSFSPLNERKKINIKKIELNKNDKDTIDNDPLLLNIKGVNHKKTNLKTNKNSQKSKKNYIQSYRMKNMNNINQFINKPNDEENNNSIHQKKLLMTPLNSKGKSKMQNSSFKLNNSKLINHDNNSDYISLASTSKLGIKTCARGRSVPSSLKNKSNIHFPNKSAIKNKDKLNNELQKIFGEKIILNDELYQNMGDGDKKNCINFLLEAIKEMFNINKNIESKYGGFKDISEAKEKQIKENKNEIKELKKEILKLNKIIKTNIQMNRKLSQNVDSLKLQLEKEKNKNKEHQTRSRSSTKSNNVKARNNIGEFSVTTTKRNRYRSLERFRDTNDFINKKKRINFNHSKDKDKKDINKKNNSIKIDNIKINQNNNNNNNNINNNEQNNPDDENKNNNNKNEVNINEENNNDKKTNDASNNGLTSKIFNED